MPEKLLHYSINDHYSDLDKYVTVVTGLQEDDPSIN